MFGYAITASKQAFYQEVKSFFKFWQVICNLVVKKWFDLAIIK